MKMKTSNQSPSKAGSAKASSCVGSGSRPNGGKLPIPSSAPKNAQKLRG